MEETEREKTEREKTEREETEREETGREETGREETERKKTEREETERDGQGEISLGEIEGYHVYIRFPEDGPTWGERKALFEQAVRSVLFRNLAECFEESAGDSVRPVQREPDSLR